MNSPKDTAESPLQTNSGTGGIGWDLPSFKDLLEYHGDCNPGGIFYHYTSVEAFESIMRSMQFRLTRYDLMHMGDDEGKEAVRVAASIINNLEDEGAISESLRDKILETLSSDIEGSFTHWYHGSGKRVPCMPYVICFTHIEEDDMVDERGFVDSIKKNDLRMEVCLDFDFLNLPVAPGMGCSTFPNWYGICYFRTMDYGKDSIRKMMERMIREILEYCRNNGRSEDFTCISIREVVNEERMFFYARDSASLKETRVVVYVPIDRDTVTGIDDVVKTRRMKNASGDWVYSLSDSGENNKYIYLDLKVPPRGLTVSVNEDSKGAFERVEAIMNKAIDAGFVMPSSVKRYKVPDIVRPDDDTMPH